KGASSWHEIPQREMFAPVTKMSVTLKGESALDSLREAVRQATTGRKGPVYIGVPRDVQTFEVELPEPPWLPQPPPPLTPDAAAIERAAGEINEAAAPIIVAGGNGAERARRNPRRPVRHHAVAQGARLRRAPSFPRSSRLRRVSVRQLLLSRIGSRARRRRDLQRGAHARLRQQSHPARRQDRAGGQRPERDREDLSGPPRADRRRQDSAARADRSVKEIGEKKKLCAAG